MIDLLNTSFGRMAIALHEASVYACLLGEQFNKEYERGAKARNIIKRFNKIASIRKDRYNPLA